MLDFATYSRSKTTQFPNLLIFLLFYSPVKPDPFIGVSRRPPCGLPCQLFAGFFGGFTQRGAGNATTCPCRREGLDKNRSASVKEQAALGYLIYILPLFIELLQR
ncbi:MAG: hypothetical protein KatS3mg022_2805 [Armatimonadota bacterium]|nr:MAG: hypothetical protein KatS3mg022_2805 [Armatimonadota bacterium]